MDRWPSEMDEPKAPDKSLEPLSAKDPNIIMKLKSEQNYASGKTDDFSPRVLPPSKEASVSSLTEPDLKALLEEAMAYKRPQDIQGKSDLFKELLQSVKCEKNYPLISRPQPEKSSSNRKPRRKQLSKPTSQEGPPYPTTALIVNMSDSEAAANKRQSKYSAKSSPSNVAAQLVPMDAASLCSESVKCEKKYSLTLRLQPEKSSSNRKPRRKQLRVPTRGDSPPKALVVHMSNASSQIVPLDAASICSETNLEVSALLENGSIESIEELQGMLSAEANIYQVKSGSGLGSANLPLTLRSGTPQAANPNHKECEEEVEARIGGKESAALTSPPKEMEVSDAGKESSTEPKRSLDENGNSVSGSRVESLVEKKSKARRLKAKNDKNTILSHQIEGHRSDIAEDIDAIMKYIESPKETDPKNTGGGAQKRNTVGLPKNSRASNKLNRVREKSSEALPRKSPKSKGSKLQKSSSLEEVSISKFEDLTQTVSDEKNFPPVPKSKSISIKTNASVPVKCKSDTVSPIPPAISPSNEIETADDFLPVIKKNRKKKHSYDNSSRNERRKISGSYRHEKFSYMGKSQKLEGFPQSSREVKRRKSISSIPSSDKSGDSSDLDSVHSFPVSSNKGKSSKSSVTQYTGSTPQISYAAIARSVPSPSRLLSELSFDNIESETSEPSQQQKDFIPTVIIQLPTKKEDYPPLSIVNKNKPDKNFGDMFVEYTVHVPKRNPSTFQTNCVSVEETVLIQMPSSDICEKEGSSHSVTLDNRLSSSQISSTVSTKRPAVILMNSSMNDSCNELTDLEFGFEVNEQLLCGCTVESEETTVEPQEESAGEVGCTLPPQTSLSSQVQVNDRSQNDYEIINFVSSEWKKTVAELREAEAGAKVVYFHNI